MEITEFEIPSKLEGTVPKIFLISDINYKFGGFHKLTSDLIIHCKDSQDSLKAIILMVMVNYREGRQIKIS